jgi:hypothetical protein
MTDPTLHAVKSFRLNRWTGNNGDPGLFPENPRELPMRFPIFPRNAT